jgi:DNA end-binding protein Ku
MPARSEWKGFLQVSQLRVPVKAFSASKSEPEIALNQLHRNCGERIQQQKHCPCHGRIENDAIISGYQVSDGEYVPIDPDELKQLRPENDKTILVERFIDHQLIDPVYHGGRTLYLVPDGPPGQRPFGVLREGLKASGRHAFSRIVLSGRERLVLLRPLGRLLAMTVLEYPQFVRTTADYESEVVQATPEERELQLIRQLIDALTDNNFRLDNYRDPYTDGLSQLIERKMGEVKLVSHQRDMAKNSSPESDSSFLAVLQASLIEAGVDGISAPSISNPLGASTNEDLQSKKLA